MINRPAPLQNFIDELARLAFGHSPSDIPGHCIKCKEPFSDKNVLTSAGWRETKISGLCEGCFDDIIKED